MLGLKDTTRAGLATILDVLLPGTELLPLGRTVGAHTDLLDRVLKADPTLLAIITTAGDLAFKTPPHTFAEIAENSGADTERLVFALHAAYYMSSIAREAIGYPGQHRLPVGDATPDQLCSDDLIEPVLGRGPIYIPTPDEN